MILLRDISLTNGLTLAAIKCLHHCGNYPRVPVIADTAVRFMPTGKDMAYPFPIAPKMHRTKAMPVHGEPMQRFSITLS